MTTQIERILAYLKHNGKAQSRHISNTLKIPMSCTKSALWALRKRGLVKQSYILPNMHSAWYKAID